jgi:hypothetical protein
LEYFLPSLILRDFGDVWKYTFSMRPGHYLFSRLEGQKLMPIILSLSLLLFVA